MELIRSLTEEEIEENENAVENGLKKGMTWLFRHFKEPIKTTDTLSKTRKFTENMGDRDGTLENGKTIPTTPIILDKDVTPAISEEAVVDNINQWRQGMAESHGVIQKFTTLNDEFTERIKEENREIDEKNISDERATKSKMEKNIKRDGDKVRYVVGNGTTTLSVWGNGFGMEGENLRVQFQGTSLLDNEEVEGTSPYGN
ncbi:hypothetical protein RhiirB3_448038 [Rhizophagus irregularis]|nr:hypothetical protein RhiirB3_448038 [Rhizophagus irregularis]